MPVTITIHGDTAAEALKELQTFAAGNTGRPVFPDVQDVPTLEKENEIARIPEILTGEQVAEKFEELLQERQSSTAELDSAGVPFDPELHTGTKKKDGTWRAKKGKADEAAALVEEVAEAEDEGNDSEPTSSDSVSGDPSPSDGVDEFAAFKEAAAQAEELVSVPERTWTDADLGQLCNDAAVKLGNPAPIKALIAKYVPEGEVPHSRNVPNDQREAFAQEVEAAAGIEYAG